MWSRGHCFSQGTEYGGYDCETIARICFHKNALLSIQIYGVLPAATAFIAVYSKASNVLRKKTLFYTTCVPFFIFFAVFDLLLHPNAERLQPSLTTVQSFLPGDATSGGMGVTAKIFANWTSALFYVIAEIYSSVSVGLLFWQFANDVVPIDQAKRFYRKCIIVSHGHKRSQSNRLSTPSPLCTT